MIRIILYSLVLTGCISGSYREEIPRELVQKLVPEFDASEFDFYLVDLLPETTEAVCDPFYDRVFYNRKHWQESSELQRRITLLHEYGHCKLNRGHRNKLFQDRWQCPKSIMHFQAVTDECFLQNPQYYLEELVYPERYN